ncbi:MAG: hypothetical protein ABIP10_11110 [Ferruginibacter sp.]
MIEKLSKVLSETEINRLAKEAGFVKRASKKVDALKFFALVDMQLKLANYSAYAIVVCYHQRPKY